MEELAIKTPIDRSRIRRKKTGRVSVYIKHEYECTYSVFSYIEQGVSIYTVPTVGKATSLPAYCTCDYHIRKTAAARADVLSVVHAACTVDFRRSTHFITTC